MAIDATLDHRFADAMAGFSPYEPNAEIAIALSGGGDSVALLHLTNHWARNRDVRIRAVTVDHGLRMGSASEAQTVAGWADDLGVPHTILQWEGGKPTAGVMAAARDARYRLMDRWCGAEGVLHLLVGHTLDDQAETHLMRKNHASAADGLAAMSQILELSQSRLIRPLLKTTRAELRTYLNRTGITWIEDPSNFNVAFERISTRNHIVSENLDLHELSEIASKKGENRVIQNREIVEALVDTVEISSLGSAVIKLDNLASYPPRLTGRVVSRVLTVVGGGQYAPATAKVNSLLAQLHKSKDKETQTVSLGGCSIIRHKNHLQVLRERRNLPNPQVVAPLAQIHWDNRFKMTFGQGLERAVGNAQVSSFADADWGPLKKATDVSWLGRRAYDTCKSLPVIRDEQGLFAIPHMHYERQKTVAGEENASDIVSFLSFCPLNSLSGNGFSVA